MNPSIQEKHISTQKHSINALKPRPKWIKYLINIAIFFYSTLDADGPIAPQVIGPRTVSVTAKVGATVSLPCNVNGYPAPTVT